MIDLSVRNSARQMHRSTLATAENKLHRDEREVDKALVKAKHSDAAGSREPARMMAFA